MQERFIIENTTAYLIENDKACAVVFNSDLSYKKDKKEIVNDIKGKETYTIEEIIAKLNILDKFKDEYENENFDEELLEKLKGKEIEIANLQEDLAAEQKARATYEKLIDLSRDNPDVVDPLRYLREREVVHFQRFGEALRGVQDKLAEKKFYMNDMTPYSNDCGCR